MKSIPQAQPKIPMKVLSFALDASLRLYWSSNLNLFQKGSFSNIQFLPLFGGAGLSASDGATFISFLTANQVERTQTATTTMITERVEIS